MPTTETPDGKPVTVGPIDAEAVTAQFQAAKDDDGPDEYVPPKRQPSPAAEAGQPKPRRGRPAKEEKARTVAKAAAVLGDKERADGVKGLAQLGAGVCLMLGKATKKDAYKADAVTIASYADQIADACVQVAHNDAGFAAALDKVCSVGPYGALIGVMVGVGSQLARNHRPGLAIPGTTDPAVLLASAAEQEAQQGAQHVPVAALCEFLEYFLVAYEHATEKR